MRVSWEHPVADQGVTGYRVYVREAGVPYAVDGQFYREPWDSALRPTNPPTIMAEEVSYTPPLAEGEVYCFALTAHNADGDQSRLSEEICIGEVEPCVVDSCTSLESCTFETLPDGASCTDGDACNGAEACVGGYCTPAAPPNCDDGNSCTSDTCESLDGCTHTPMSGCEPCGLIVPCNDNNPCTADWCNGGLCEYTPATNGTSCSDGNPCNGLETCSGTSCVPGTPLSCNDGDVCTTDTCDPLTGCVHTPTSGCETCTVTADCEDGNPCTADRCTNDRCEYAPLEDGSPCEWRTDCEESGVCMTGLCQPSFSSQFQVRRLKVTAGRGDPSLTLGGYLWPANPFDPTSTGVGLEIADGSGAVLFGAVVGGHEMIANRRGTRFKFDRSRATGDSGLRRLSLRKSRPGYVKATVRARTAELANLLEHSQLTWTLRIGEQCFFAEALACLSGWSGKLLRCWDPSRRP